MSNQIILFLLLIACIVQCILTFAVFNKKDEKNRKARPMFLGMTMYSIVQMGALFATDYFMESLLQSISFSLVTISIASCLRFFIWEIYQEKVKLYPVLTTVIIGILSLADVIMLFINPFKEYLVSYSYDVSRSLYWLKQDHLGMCYHYGLVHVMIIFTMAVIIRKCINVALVYAGGYYIILAGMFLFGTFNLIFAFISINEKYVFLPFLFTAFMLLIYNTLFYYVDGSMLDHIGTYAMNEFTNPVIIFDYKDRMIISNNEFRKLSERVIKYRNKEQISDYIGYKKYSLADFKRDFFVDTDSFEEDKFFNVSYMEGRNVISYRVDYTRVSDDASKIIGQMFIFTDTTQEMDVLTGFHKKEAFNKYFETSHSDFTYPAGVIMFDIKGLNKYNEEHGKENGNRIIQLVAMNMMRYCPKNSYFLRGQEANLYAVCPGSDENRIKEIISNICKALGQDDNRRVVTVRSTYGLIASEIQSVIQVTDTITLNMKTKKMIDIDADRSSILDSLIQMQKEADPLLARHIKRTRYLSKLMAEKLQMTDHQSNNLTLLALIHDIGNIGVPMEIINKPGRLTAIEWEIMKSHVLKGYRIAQASAEFKDISLCILHHHECFDGSGYPDGLAGESIPYLARVIAVIEAYDAMTNERPYRPPMSSVEAIKEITKCKGKQYDPKIVDIFVDLVGELAPTENAVDNKLPEENKEKLTPMSLSEEDNSHGYVEQIKHSSYMLNYDDEIIEIDEAFSTITGYSKEDVKRLHMNQRNLIFEADQEYYFSQVEKYIETTGEVYLEHRIRCKDGSEKYVFCYGRRYYDNAVKAGRTAIMITDVSESKRLAVSETLKFQGEDILAGMSDKSILEAQNKEYDENEYVIDYKDSDEEVDSLTGLISAKLYDRLNERLFANTEENLLLMLIDIDNFVGFSKTNGKDKAYELLSYFGNMLVQTISNEGITARVSLDTFACTLTLLSDNDTELAKAKGAEVWGSLMDTINDKYEGTTLSVGAAFGMLNNGNARDYKEIYKKASDALEKVKKEGRNGYLIV